MFKWIKGQSGAKPTTSARPDAAQVTTTASASDQLTRALLIKAAQHNAQTRKSLIELSESRPVLHSNKLDADIDRAMAVVTFTIVDDAMREAFGEREYRNFYQSMSGDPLPSHVHLLVAFVFAIVVLFARKLRSEGIRINLDSKQPCVGVIDTLFLFRSTAEKVEIFTMGANAFATISKSGASNVVEWFNSLDKLLVLYLLDNEKLKARGFPSMFGQMLKSLLATAN